MFGGETTQSSTVQPAGVCVCVWGMRGGEAYVQRFNVSDAVQASPGKGTGMSCRYEPETVVTRSVVRCAPERRWQGGKSAQAGSQAMLVRPSGSSRPRQRAAPERANATFVQSRSVMDTWQP